MIIVSLQTVNETCGKCGKPVLDTPVHQAVIMEDVLNYSLQVNPFCAECGATAAVNMTAHLKISRPKPDQEKRKLKIGIDWHEPYIW